MPLPAVPGLGPSPFLYPLIDTHVCAARKHDPVALAQAYLAGGARLLQLRCKGPSSGAFLDLADRLVAVTGAAGATLVINDRADIARLSRAGGVHVGQQDLSVADARALVGVRTIVGVSTHDELQIDAALETTATYIAVGPVFGTTTKATGYTARGLHLVRYASSRGKPVVAIGGVTLERAPSLVEAGAAGLAVITDLLAEADVEGRTRRFIQAIS